MNRAANKKRYRALALLAALLVLAWSLAACGAPGDNSGGGAREEAQAGGQSAADAGNEGGTAPEGEDAGGDEQPNFGDFTAVDLEGNTVDEGIFADYNLTMVNVWGTFCGPCIKEMPELGEINRDYGGENFQIVGIVIDVLNQDLSASEEMVDTAREIVDKTKADYLHLIPSEDLLMAGIASIRGVPFTFFVDREGAIVGDVYSGSKSKSDWEKIIEDTLKEVQ